MNGMILLILIAVFACGFNLSLYGNRHDVHRSHFMHRIYSLKLLANSWFAARADLVAHGILKGSHKSNTGILHIPFAQPISILFNSLSRLINCRSFSIPMCWLVYIVRVGFCFVQLLDHRVVLCTKLLIVLWTHIECATPYVLHDIYFNLYPSERSDESKPISSYGAMRAK